MSREIKFRALYFNTDKSRCEWAYGLIGYMGDKGVQVFSRERNADGNADVFNCLNGTEGQFTGLRDKNGKEIYEGDILGGSPNWECQLAEVRWSNGGFVKYGLYSIGWTDTPIADGISRFVVIGNIHENHELLNQTGH